MRYLSTEGSLVRNILVLAGILSSAAAAALGQSPPSLPTTFRATTIHSPEGAEIFVRSGGTGFVVVLVHGYAENSDSWGPLAADLMKDYTVVVPDLRGIGRSSKPEAGYDKKDPSQGHPGCRDHVGYDRTSLVAHDIGNMVAYAYAAMYPGKVEHVSG
jgi:pimeloyl-ACP methyl ester carboxylesterase